jgi:hypothetical protein
MSDPQEPRTAPSPTPALDYVLRVEPVWYGPGFDCVECPFAGPPDHVDEDPAEAYYPCDLLGLAVWGEEPACESADWRTRARRELWGEPGIPNHDSLKVSASQPTQET